MTLIFQVLYICNKLRVFIAQDLIYYAEYILYYIIVLLQMLWNVLYHNIIHFIKNLMYNVFYIFYFTWFPIMKHNFYWNLAVIIPFFSNKSMDNNNQLSLYLND